MENEHRLAHARCSLEGLSVGDAFGELFFRLPPERTSPDGLPPGPWPWTDDTHMALSIVEVLRIHGRIEQDALARAFARRFREEPHRGYGRGAARLLAELGAGGDWRQLSPRLFGGGSFGNGAAMRVAPVGAYFCDDIERAAREARLSAVVTHTHPEGQAGAIAVAAAAALASRTSPPTGSAFLGEVLPVVPAGLTRDRIAAAVEIPPDALAEAVDRLGTGYEVSAPDTVPFCLWSAAYRLHNFAEALWWTAKGRGDCDTTCAIVGGIAALSAPAIPACWRQRREPLPP
jgi:ADP-ribosylglycohydrolase